MRETHAGDATKLRPLKLGARVFKNNSRFKISFLKVMKGEKIIVEKDGN